MGSEMCIRDSASIQDNEDFKGEDLTAAELARDLVERYDRTLYESDQHFGQTMYQIVESLAKTEEKDVVYDVIRHLREMAYDNPSQYLDFTIDKSLVDIYIETFDFERALDRALSIIENPDYKQLEDAQSSQASTLSEIAYLYNRLGDGKNALIYLCLLYTSPSPRDLSTSRMPSSA